MLKGLRSRLRRPGSKPGIIDKGEIAPFLPSNPTILEAGAYGGEDTVDMLRVWPGATIHAFEPVPELFTRLERRTQALSSVHRYQAALGPSSGTAVMHLSSGDSDASSSILAPKAHLTRHPGVTFDEEIRVPQTTLDDWLAHHQIDIDFLWLDLQGAELEVLKSGEQLLRSVSAIHTEVWLEEGYEGAPAYDEVRAWLAGKGFRLAIEAGKFKDAVNVLFARE